jgi:hypothetical protein
MVILEAEETNNCVAAKKFHVTENNVRRWRQQKNDLLNSSGTRKAFRGPKRGRFGEIEIEVAKYVADMRREGFPVTMESIQVKGREIARNLYIREFKASMSWCKRMMRRKWLVLLLNFLFFFLNAPFALLFGAACVQAYTVFPLCQLTTGDIKRQCAYNITLWRVRVTTIAVETHHSSPLSCLLHVAVNINRRALPWKRKTGFPLLSK